MKSWKLTFSYTIVRISELLDISAKDLIVSNKV